MLYAAAMGDLSKRWGKPIEKFSLRDFAYMRDTTVEQLRSNMGLKPDHAKLARFGICLTMENLKPCAEQLGHAIAGIYQMESILLFYLVPADGSDPSVGVVDEAGENFWKTVQENGGVVLQANGHARHVQCRVVEDTVGQLPGQMPDKKSDKKSFE